MELIKDIINIIQGIVIICATIFTARWAYKTFAYKERISELKELKKTINLYHWKMQIFCAQVRKNETPDNTEIQEKLELASIHNKLIALYDLSLFVRPETRKRIIEIVGSWITNERLDRMQHRNWSKLTKEKRDEVWKKFDNEYKEVKDIINKEAAKYV